MQGEAEHQALAGIGHREQFSPVAWTSEWRRGGGGWVGEGAERDNERGGFDRELAGERLSW